MNRTALLALGLALGCGKDPAPACPPCPPCTEANVASTDVVGPVLALKPFVVNLDEPGPSRYLKLTLQFELVAADFEEMFSKNEQRIRDAILSYLSGLRVADLLGSAAKDKLRGEITRQMEAIVGPRKVRRVFFQEFMVQ